MMARRRSRLERFFIAGNRALRDRTDGYLARRPHRSFRRTRRRDYARPLALPGLLGLTLQALGLIRRNAKLFGSFFVVYTLISALVLGVVSQANYSALVNAFKSAKTGVWQQTFAIFGTALTGGLNAGANTDSKLIAVLLGLLAWLVLVWLLRHVSAGTKVRLRDGLYNAGAPIIPMAVVSFVGLVQCIPLIIAVIGYSVANTTGVLSGGVETMLFWVVVGLLALLSLYWLTATAVALVIVTLPGMYPWPALRAAGDLVVGRRLRLMLQLVWLALVVLVVWAIVLVPAILLGSLTPPWLPLVPLTVLGLTTATLVLASTYIFILYRRLVDDQAGPV